MDEIEEPGPPRSKRAEARSKGRTVRKSHLQNDIATAVQLRYNAPQMSDWQTHAGECTSATCQKFGRCAFHRLHGRWLKRLSSPSGHVWLSVRPRAWGGEPRSAFRIVVLAAWDFFLFFAIVPRQHLPRLGPWGASSAPELRRRVWSARRGGRGSRWRARCSFRTSFSMLQALQGIKNNKG